MRRVWTLAAALLCSCGDPQTGGFETTDLQARAVRPDGVPVASARVWLVRSAGDSAPATAIDSALSDQNGLVRFSRPDGGNAGLGLDVLLGDSLGMSPLALTGSDTARVVLVPSHVVSLPSSSPGEATCHVPGSHFASRYDAAAGLARLPLPTGTWNLAVRRSGTVSVTSIQVAADTVLAGPSTPSTMDTTARDSLVVRAARYQSQTQEGLELDVVNETNSTFDSLTVRLYMSGTSVDMADFAVRLDLAQLYTAAGFNRPAGLVTSAWPKVAPKAIGTCPTASVCTWALDLPLDTVSIEPQGRLRVSFLFDKHVTQGDSLVLGNTRPVHDPFSGSDWSFRARTWADSATAIPGMPDYGGVPSTSSNDLPAIDPYIVLLRKRRLLSGIAPSPLL